MCGQLNKYNIVQVYLCILNLLNVNQQKLRYTGYNLSCNFTNELILQFRVIDGFCHDMNLYETIGACG